MSDIKIWFLCHQHFDVITTVVFDGWLIGRSITVIVVFQKFILFIIMSVVRIMSKEADVLRLLWKHRCVKNEIIHSRDEGSRVIELTAKWAYKVGWTSLPGLYRL